MRQSNVKLKSHFIGWQCRIRQISAREHGGEPLPAMRPRVSRRDGMVLLPAMTILLVPLAPAPSTAYFRFQMQRTNEAEKTRQSGLNYLAADFYQLPELFSGEMTAVFGPASATAQVLAKAKDVLLDFEQYSQIFRMLCRVRQLSEKDPARELSLWQARLFNPNVPNDAVVLGFRPAWKNAAADPMPPS